MTSRRTVPWVVTTLIAMFATLGAHGQNCDSACDASPALSCLPSNSCSQLWSLQTNTLYVHRSKPDFAILAYNTDNPAENLNANSLNYDFETGFDLTLTRKLNSGSALELRYFGIDDWNAFATTSTTPNDLLQFNAAVPVTVDAGDAISAYYESELHNLEVNLRHSCVDNVDFLVGFRHLQLDEKGAAVLENASVPYTYTTATENRLYGAQLGAQAWLWCGDNLSIDTIFKGGIYGNDASHNASATTGTATLLASGNDNATSFVGEWGLNGILTLSDRLAVRGGYRLTWIDDVAVAPEQLAATDFFAGTGIDSSGDVLYHGLFVGLQLTR